MSKMITRASSINRALDQIGDKWCLLIIQEVFWGVNSFTGMLSAMGVSRGVLSDRLKWLQSIDALQQKPDAGGKRMKYHLTRKSIDLYDNALMALNWERTFFSIPALDDIALTHSNCGHLFTPQLRCRHCNELVTVRDVSYKPGPGAARDERNKKVRRRSSIPMANVPSERNTYKNLINIVGDRWTANIIALSFHGLTRFDQFHQELPIATNILADRLKFLLEQGIFERSAYQQRPLRYEYKLTEKGEASYPYFLTLLQWGDKWCNPAGDGKPMRLTHTSCGRALQAQVKCSECGDKLKARDVEFSREEDAK
jgi:DNA-binding HxlR family transcriptional regulator